MYGPLTISYKLQKNLVMRTNDHTLIYILLIETKDPTYLLNELHMSFFIMGITWIRVFKKEIELKTLDYKYRMNTSTYYELGNHFTLTNFHDFLVH